MTEKLITKYSIIKWAGLIVLFFLHLTLQYFNAWLSDDALITSRSIYNLVNGFGLVWNTTERVQAFTHPLWLFTITPFYCLTGEFSKTIMLLSIAISLATLLFLTLKFSQNIATTVVLIIAMTVSTAYMDYATSGLENPLTHLLLVLFVWISLQKRNAYSVFSISLLFSFMLLNRLDLLLLTGPLFLYFSITQFNQIKEYRRMMLLGFTPFILWELFSFVYYGFWLPNTYYAKIHTGIDRYDLISQGALYFVDSLIHDFVTLPIIALGIIIGMIRWRHQQLFWLSLGIILYLLYIIWIGGDFMRGRFFSAPFVAALMIISQISFNRLTCVIISLILITLGLANDTTLRFDKMYENKETLYGIADERGYYHFNRNLFTNETGSFFEPIQINHSKPTNWEQAKPVTSLGAGAGIIGLASGPYVHVIDQCALGDPLLSKIAISGDSLKYWRVGHYSRDLPHGYKQSLAQSQNLIRHQSLAQYYDQLKFNISGPLFSLSRLWNVTLMNLGYYDHWLDDYNLRFEKPTKMQLDELDTLLDGVGWTDQRVTIIYEGGLMVDLGETKHPQTINVSFDNNDQYQLTFFQNNKEIGQITIDPRRDKVGVVNNQIDLPESIITLGFNRILIKPTQGDGIYCIGHLLLK